MPNTTPDAICSGLESLIAGLTPKGGTTVGTNSSYELASDELFSEGIEESPESDLDRRFMVMSVDPTAAEVQGGITSNLLTGKFEVQIGHQIGSAFRSARDRRDMDIHQLLAQVINPANLPTSGTFRIGFLDSGREEIREGQFWWTTLTFELTYMMSSTY